MARTSILSASLLSLMLAVAASPMACGASAKDTEDRLLDKMSTEIDEAQSDTFKLVPDGAELGVDSGSPRAVEASEAKQAEPPPPARPTPMPTPHLRVVHLAPDGAEEAGDAQGEQAPRLSLTNASLGRQPTPRPPRRASVTPKREQRTHPESVDPPAAPRQAAPQPRDAHPPIEDEGDKPIVPDDEDDEHIVPVDEDNEHLVGGDRR